MYINNNKYFSKTIIAQSTPIGNGGIGIIRISGNKSLKIAKKILGKKPKIRYAEYLPFKNKKNIIIDYGISIFYKSPNSFTGEDILELHSHGGQKIIELIIQSLIDLKIKNTRIAKPGEFTKRAFWNNKIDLIQAESINDLINAKSYNNILCGLKSLKGNLSKKIKKIIYLVKKTIINLEKKISFSEKKIKKTKIIHINKNINKIKKKIKKIYIKSKNNFLLNEDIQITIIGKPNVGKSSLINLITKKNTSIVTNIPGTTRDIIKEYININNIKIKITDTAGIHKTKNKIEKIGIKKIKKEIKKSKFILYLNNSTDTTTKNIIKIYKKEIEKKYKIKKNKIIFLLRNKIDITKEKIKTKKNKNYFIMNISTKKNKGVKELLKIIKNKIKKFNLKNIFLLKQRHIKLIKKSLNYIKKIKTIFKYYLITKKINIDIIYQYLIKIEKKLNETIGKKKITSNKIIENIFSKFCIGK